MTCYVITCLYVSRLDDVYELVSISSLSTTNPHFATHVENVLRANTSLEWSAWVTTSLPHYRASRDTSHRRLSPRHVPGDPSVA